MAASNEIRFKIGADTSALSAGFAKAASVAAAAGKQIEKKLGMQDAFKASAVALGLSVDKIATKVAEFFSGGSAENWKAAADAAERTAAIMDASAEKRLSLEQQIQKIKLEIESESGNTSRAQRMNAPTSVFNPFTGKMGQAQSMAEDAAEAEKRSAEARERIATKEAKISALKEAQAEAYGQIVKAEEQLEELGMSSERRHKLLLEDAEAIKKDRDAAIQGNKEWMPLQLAYTQKLITAGQLELQITREQTAERQKQAAIMDKLQKAGMAAGSAVSDKEDARKEALRFTIDEAAAGERGNAKDQKTAQQILADEKAARELFDKGPGANMGKEFTGYNQKTGYPMFRIRDQGFFSDRAERLRSGFDKLKSADRNPFEAVDSRLKEAVAELVQLNEKLGKDE